MRSHHGLDVWQKSMDLVVLVYEITRQFPPSERYGLISQLQRAATSVPANIAEGKARGSRKEYAHHASIARGSLTETETLLQLALRLNYVPPDAIRPALTLIDDVNRMLHRLRASLIDRPPEP